MSTQTPLMKQYSEIKARHTDAILFFRLGDFYEMFADDALWASSALGLTLTHRHGTPMCGIPHHASEGYIAKLLEKGKKVALCEQISLEKKGIATRDVVEILTPGAIVGQNYIQNSKSNYLAALTLERNLYSFSYLDLSTAEFVAFSTSSALTEWFFDELDKLSPKELIINETLLDEDFLLQLGDYSFLVNRYPSWLFDRGSAYNRLCKQFEMHSLKAFGFEEDDVALGAAGALFDYIIESTKRLLPHLKSIRKEALFTGLIIDEQSRKSLELIENSSERDSKFTLLRSLDQTISPMGSRLLRSWILNPLNSISEINKRLDRVELLVLDPLLLSNMRTSLNKIQDIERLSSKIAMDKAHGKDLLALSNSLGGILELSNLLGNRFIEHEQIINEVGKAKELISQQLADDPAIVLNEGNLIKVGVSEELDRLRELKIQGNRLLEEYADEQRRSTAINLRLKTNRVIGVFFEVNKTNAERLPSYFIRRQMVTGAERYSTTDLDQLYHEIITADESAMALEASLFMALCNELKLKLSLFLSVAQAVALWDVSGSFALVAQRQRYSRPILVAERGINIKEGRHPVIEQAVNLGDFIPNNFVAGKEYSFLLITGPNMAGKSTYLRQNALIVLMAQIGSFVSAAGATIGIVDKIFCRVGSGDNLAKGESTFLVEMNETARILHSATERSLVIMDEVGRGTGSDDGLALAHAIVDYLVTDLKSITLFATHYHELTNLTHPSMKNYRLRVKEEGGRLYFLKQLEEGAAAGSYGIDVAKLAGIPQRVVDAARIYLEELSHQKGIKPVFTQSDTNKTGDRLFSNNDLIMRALSSFDLNTTTPLKALNFIAKLKDDIND